MTDRPVFHLALPVGDLHRSVEFYTRTLQASVGRRNEEWADVLLWGHQITLHHRPDEVLPRERQGKRHFGVILPWSDWDRLADRLRGESAGFLREPEVSHEGTPREQAKLYLEDPAHNVIEIKAYRNPEAALMSPGGDLHGCD